MWIHIPSNETGCEMPKTRGKHSHKLGKGNPMGHTYADQEVTTANGKETFPNKVTSA